MHHELLQRIVTGFFIGIFFGAIFFYTKPIFFSLFLLFILLLILIYEMPRLLPYKNSTSWIVTIFYPIAPFIMLIILNDNTKYRFLVFLIFLLTFAQDVGAYFVGKYFGKHRLCPTISPKKTWEGFFGGVATVFLVLFILVYSNHCKHTLRPIFFFSIVLASVATIGDLFESWLKRRARIKDSGTLLPGHGGLLDRFDSILAVTVLVYFSRHYLQKFLCW